MTRSPAVLGTTALILTATIVASARDASAQSPSGPATPPPSATAATPAPVTAAVTGGLLELGGDFDGIVLQVTPVGVQPDGAPPLAICGSPCRVPLPLGRYRVASIASSDHRPLVREVEVTPAGAHVSLHRGRTPRAWTILTGAGVASTVLGALGVILAPIYVAVVNIGRSYSNGLDATGAVIVSAVVMVGGIGSIAAGSVFGSRDRSQQIVVDGPQASARHPIHLGLAPIPNGFTAGMSVEF